MTVIRTDSPLLIIIPVKLLKIIHDMTGHYFPQIMIKEEWRSFINRIYAEENSSCVIASRESHGYRFKFMWNATDWTLTVCDADNDDTLAWSKIFNGSIARTRRDLADRPLIYSFNEEKQAHIPVQGDELLVSVSGPPSSS